SMRTVWLPVRLLVAASLAAVTALAAKPPEFPQATRVHGKVPVDMSAAWFPVCAGAIPRRQNPRARDGGGSLPHERVPAQPSLAPISFRPAMRNTRQRSRH